MAEETLLALIFANLWNPWIFILGKIGGYEAVALAVPVTLAMLILGSLTYFLLKFIVLAKLLEKAGGEDNKATNSLVLIVSVAITLLSLYTGAALVLAGFIQAFGFIYALLLFFVLIFGLIFVTWKWGKGIRSGDFSGGGIFGSHGDSGVYTAPGTAGAHVSAVGAGQNAMQGHAHSAQAVHDLDGLEDLIHSEHEAYRHIDKMLSNVRVFSSEENINKAIVFLNKLRTIAQNNPSTRDLLNKINALMMDVQHIKTHANMLKKATFGKAKIERAAASKTGYTKKDYSRLMRELTQIDNDLKNLTQKEQALVKAKNNMTNYLLKRNRLLVELIILLGKKNIRRNLPKIKDTVRHLLLETAPNGPIQTALAQEETLIKQCDLLFIKIKNLISQVDYINRQLNRTP